MCQFIVFHNQHKLQEIEEVARQLELALNSKDGDPQTPIYARMLMDSFSSGSKSSHGHGSSQEGSQPSPDSSPTLRRLREMRELQQSLQAVEKERDSLRARVEESEAAGSAGVDLEASMSGEKLKWQMEMANLRKEYETRMEQEQEGTSKERTSLETKVASVERAYATLQGSSRTACSELEQNLSEAKQRWAMYKDSTGLVLSALFPGFPVCFTRTNRNPMSGNEAKGNPSYTHTCTSIVGRNIFEAHRRPDYLPVGDTY